MPTLLSRTVQGLLRSPGFALFAILSIGVGVGASSAMFSLTEQALLRHLPVKEPGRLALLSWQGYFVGNTWDSGDVSYPLYQELRENNEVFEELFARYPTSVHFADGEAAEAVRAEIVTGTYFPTLGVRPALGRLIEPSDDREPDAHPVIVVSHDFWRNRLGGDPGVVGRRVFLNGGPMTIIGVAEPGFYGVDWGETPSLWIPTMMKRQATPSWNYLLDPGARWLHVFGRLKPGVSPEIAQASLQPWFKAQLQAYTEGESFLQVTDNIRRQFLDSTLAVAPAARGRSSVRDKVRTPFLALLGATGLILALACLNVANLSLARMLGQIRSTALRTALGASRVRIAGEHLAESAVLAVCGGLLGLLLAPTLAQALRSYLRSAASSVVLTADLNPAVVGFAVIVTAVTAVTAGLAPAFLSSRVRPIAALKEQASTVSGGLRLRKALVAGQIGLALILLVCAGLFAQTLARLRAEGPGFETAKLTTFHLDLLKNGYSRTDAASALQRILDGLRSSPDVEMAGAAWNELLTGGGWNQRLIVEAEPIRAGCNAITPGFFDSLGVSLLSGRDFTERDSSPGGESGWRSAIVNESFAKKYLGDRNPIGARLGFGSTTDTPRNIEIVGVVADFHYMGLRETEDQVFVPMFEAPGGWATFYVRTRGGPEAAAGVIRQAVRDVDATLPVGGLRALEDRLHRLLIAERLLAFLATAFGAIAMFLAVLGLYGVASFMAARRTREVGIRIALGASRASAQRLIVGDAARLVAAGVAVALPVAAWLGKLIESQLYGVSGFDGPTILAAAALVAGASLAASAIPARKAAAVHPAQSLRSE